MWKVTTAVKKILAMKKRKKVIQGSSSAGKTIAVLGILIDRAIRRDNLIIHVIGPTFKHLDGGAMADFKKVMKWMKRWDPAQWNDTKHRYSFSNGTTIEFINADGDKAIGPRRDVLYVNEANLIDYEIYSQLAMRTSGPIYLDFNPVRRFWAHEEVMKEPDAQFVKLTYRDNEAIPNGALDELMLMQQKAKDQPNNQYLQNKVKVYVDGEIGALLGAIYQTWTTIGSVPAEAKLVGYGMDFGYSSDPNTLVAVYKWNGKLILDQLLYRKGMKNSEIAAVIKQFGASKGPIFADSSEPKSIAEIASYGIAIRAVTKGPNSIVQGIQLMQEYEFLVTETSTDLIDELGNYVWIKVNGKDEPIDAHNHILDAVRYLGMMTLGSKERKNPPKSYSFNL